MINRTSLLNDLRDLLKTLEADLLARSESDEVPEVVQALADEYDKAKQAERTALSFEDWRNDFITQMAAAWVLSCVFVRFLEDNQLLEHPQISGPGDRLQWARDQHQVYFTNHPTESDREYLLKIFGEIRDLSHGAGGDVFGKHNFIWQLPNWLGGDAASELLKFFRTINPDDGTLIHDFTDPDWDTRFLGDLYQDLSEKARKKYALLQTPDFVEEFILDRTLEPALDEFGLQPSISGEALSAGSDEQPTGHFKMIDPACGSGHFLLGAFPRILKRWKEQEPETNIRELVQRTLSSIHGVDINPFAIAIARFRLLLAALAASGVRRLADAPAYAMNLACGDSLYHGVERQQTLGDWTDESHYFRTEDADNLRRILQEGTFHAVVANPPYVTPKDAAARDAYKRLYASCYMKYSLAVPFMERVFRLAKNNSESGFSGQITANSFMKREFGKKLIEDYLPTIDVTHVVDTSGAYIPGHGTPTVIVFGRNRAPTSSTIRTIMGIRGEPATPSDPSQGLVWADITSQMDRVKHTGKFTSVSESTRDRFSSHPWSIGGGGAAELKEALDGTTTRRLADEVAETGVFGITAADDVMYAPAPSFARRNVERESYRRLIVGDEVRDWSIHPGDSVLFPYESEALIDLRERVGHYRWLWPNRTVLWSRATFAKKTYREEGRTWWEWHQTTLSRLRTPESITFGEVATHNHFVRISGRSLFKQTAPIVKLATHASQDDHDRLLALLNSSSGAFWLKQICQPKGSSGIGRGSYDEAWEKHFAFNGSKLAPFPVPSSIQTILPNQLSLYGAGITRIVGSVSTTAAKTALGGHILDSSRSYGETLGEMIRLQEDLDWECYRLYGLLEDDLTYPTEESLGIQLGERAFEIVLARKMARSEVATTWFSRHGSQPITELPSHWPDDYKQLVQKRIDVIESDKNIALIEQPEYKRRWNTTPWEEQVQKALKSWLLDRLESYFDFDGRMKDSSGGFQPPSSDGDENGGKMPPVPHDGDKMPPVQEDGGKMPPLREIALYSLSKLAAVASEDPQFMEVAEVYRDDPAFDVLALIEDLVAAEHVPLLPVLRYKPAGIRKRAEWEQTWQWQRLEDELRDGKPFTDSRVRSLADDCGITDQQQSDIEAWQQKTTPEQRSDTTAPIARELDAILSITVPPKYKSSDFISTGGAKFWKLRGKLDVPKERWVSFPHCEGNDGTMMIAWAGYDHLQLARAISAHYVDIKNNLGGNEDPRLVPLLAGIMELLPWLHQWHNEVDPEFDMRMNEYYDNTFVESNAAELCLSREEIRNWQPPKKKPKRRSKKKATKKKKETTDA
ncbi:BREX-2 system adenine-specific DNA-methyltransferase PglX [Mariniblastus fucicola]|uniref:site-specific DNA-methyltransferase (adenine-specific) n=1 Tax=Mariniblastus fucicola TaxID=980251 RepID=A0A5B9PGN8_9BACT|nr:BREX-2 system adenine-specific DNA-methyltransferase PglX [Mariniblastus fucicola]QEG24769.1 Modification methylase PaeR7I [Mariniblastus fucicola]